MKHLLFALFTLTVLPLQNLHAEDAVYHYQGKITGLYCSACAAKVKASLKKMEGVSAIKITSSKEQGVQNIILESSSQALTTDKAIKALGEDAKSFTVLSLEKAENVPAKETGK